MTAFRRTAISPLFQAKRTRPTSPCSSRYGANIQRGIFILLGRLHRYILGIHVLEHGAYESVINKHLPCRVKVPFSTRFLRGTLGTGAQIMYSPVEEANEDEDPEQRIGRRAYVWVLWRRRNLQIAFSISHIR